MKKNALLPVILTATAFGLLAGAAGSLFTNAYSSGTDSFGLNREFNLSNYGYLSPNLVIRDAKKVVVNQDVKADETIRDLRGSLLGVFAKKTSGDTFYDLKHPFAQALAATTDGWVMAAWPKDLSAAEAQALKETYIVVDSSRKVYSIDQVLFAPDKVGGFVFIHLKDAIGLNVRRLAGDAEIKTGSSVIVASMGDSFTLDTIASKTFSGPVLSSDSYPQSIRVNTGEMFRPAFIFNLSGDIVAVRDWRENRLLAPELDAYWRALLKTRTLALPSLGVTYLNLSLVAGDSKLPEKGALLRADKDAPAVAKGSAAEKAGLKAGDIITRVEGVELNSDNDLATLLATYNPGDRILLSYVRNGLPAQTEVTLGTKE